MQRMTDGAKVRFPPPLVYAGGLALGIAAGRIWNLPGFGPGPHVRDPLGWMLVFGGAIVSAAGVGLFVRSGTAIIPYKPAAVLVTSGIYRWTRNPMYLGLAVIYAGTALLLNSLPALVLLPVVLAIIQYGVIAKEEAYLERAFGGKFDSYRNRVRRWI